ncbi:MAG: extracellular solute-binding protein [Gammaproteobacteria bacterium]|nr:extracellular solute-binding protein [Gammaproteobacteria bacterium]
MNAMSKTQPRYRSRVFTLLGSLVLVGVAMAALIGCTGSQAPPRGVLTIYSTTDSTAFAPVIADFGETHPEVEVVYIEIEGLPQYERFLAEVDAGQPGADLLLSSSMDLQAKLVNDGYAQGHASVHADALPAWARWRNEAFGFTFEPAVMVFDARMAAERPVPQSRAELLESLKDDRAFWRGRVGTYDIALSGVGYLLASQDDRQYSDFRLLMEAFGEVEVRLEENTSTLLSLIERGELLMGYNVLGSYARSRVDAGARLTIVHPSEYTLVVSRTAVIPDSAPNPRAAQAFLDYLLSPRGQATLAREGGLSAIREDMTGPHSRLGMAGAQVGLLRPIPLGPGLLAYRDQQKQQSLLAAWRNLIQGRESRPPAD